MTQPLSTRPIVLDTTCLVHFDRIDRIDVLGHYLKQDVCHLPDYVRYEIQRGVAAHSSSARISTLEWLRHYNIDTLPRLQSFADWSTKVGAGQRNLGEAAVLTAAEELSAVALIDDRDAAKVGSHYGIEVHGTVWLLARGVVSKALSEVEAENTVDALIGKGMRRPCTGADFGAFARQHNLL